MTFDRNGLCIGAANCSKKLMKNREVETLPVGSGGTGNVPTVSGS